jgi:hypothetical protein
MDDCGEIKKLIETIKSAFAGVLYPGKENIAGGVDYGDLESFKDDSWTDWEDVPDKVIDFNFDSLPLLSPAAFKFFLPSFLRRSLTDDCDGDLVRQFVLVSLSPSDVLKHPTEFLEGKSRDLDKHQINAVILFLEYCVRFSSDPDSSDPDDAEQAKKCLDGFWRDKQSACDKLDISSN